MILSAEEKAARTYRQFDSFLQTANRHATDRAKVRLLSEARKAADAYRSGAGEAHALGEIQESPWVFYLDAVWRDVVTNAGRLTVEALGGKADSGAFERIARLYLDRNAHIRGAGIANTSRNLVEKSISDGVEAHETLADIARRIVADAQQMAVWRSATIGSTESHSAGYLGAWSGAMQTLRGWWKVWAKPRARGVTCDQHKSTHGQRRALRDSFDVFNDYEPDEPREHMAYPGDGERGARPSNIINCRCAMEFFRP